MNLLNAEIDRMDRGEALDSPSAPSLSRGHKGISPIELTQGGPITVANNLRPGEEISLGRNHQTIESTQVAQDHAKIGRDEDGNWYIEDLSSGLPTRIMRVTPSIETLKDNDQARETGDKVYVTSSAQKQITIFRELAPGERLPIDPSEEIYIGDTRVQIISAAKPDGSDAAPQQQQQQLQQPQLNGPPSSTHNSTDSTQPAIELTQKASTLSDEERHRQWEAQQRGQGQDPFANGQYSDHGVPAASQTASTADSASSNSMAPGAVQQQQQQQQQSGGSQKRRRAREIARKQEENRKKKPAQTPDLSKETADTLAPAPDEAITLAETSEAIGHTREEFLEAKAAVLETAWVSTNFLLTLPVQDYRTIDAIPEEITQTRWQDFWFDKAKQEGREAYKILRRGAEILVNRELAETIISLSNRVAGIRQLSRQIEETVVAEAKITRLAVIRNKDKRLNFDHYLNHGSAQVKTLCTALQTARKELEAAVDDSRPLRESVEHKLEQIFNQVYPQKNLTSTPVVIDYEAPGDNLIAYITVKGYLHIKTHFFLTVLEQLNERDSQKIQPVENIIDRVSALLAHEKEHPAQDKSILALAIYLAPSVISQLRGKSRQEARAIVISAAQKLVERPGRSTPLSPPRSAERLHDIKFVYELLSDTYVETQLTPAQIGIDQPTAVPNHQIFSASVNEILENRQNKPLLTAEILFGVQMAAASRVEVSAHLIEVAENEVKELLPVLIARKESILSILKSVAKTPTYKYLQAINTNKFIEQLTQLRKRLEGNQQTVPFAFTIDVGTTTSAFAEDQGASTDFYNILTAWNQEIKDRAKAELSIAEYISRRQESLAYGAQAFVAMAARDSRAQQQQSESDSRKEGEQEKQSNKQDSSESKKSWSGLPTSEIILDRAVAALHPVYMEIASAPRFIENMTAYLEISQQNNSSAQIISAALGILPDQLQYQNGWLSPAYNHPNYPETVRLAWQQFNSKFSRIRQLIQDIAQYWETIQPKLIGCITEITGAAGAPSLRATLQLTFNRFQAASYQQGETTFAFSPAEFLPGYFSANEFAYNTGHEIEHYFHHLCFIASAIEECQIDLTDGQGLTDAQLPEVLAAYNRISGYALSPELARSAKLSRTEPINDAEREVVRTLGPRYKLLAESIQARKSEEARLDQEKQLLRSISQSITDLGLVPALSRLLAQAEFRMHLLSDKVKDQGSELISLLESSNQSQIVDLDAKAAELWKAILADWVADHNRNVKTKHQQYENNPPEVLARAAGRRMADAMSRLLSQQQNQQQQQNRQQGQHQQEQAPVNVMVDRPRPSLESPTTAEIDPTEQLKEDWLALNQQIEEASHQFIGPIARARHNGDVVAAANFVRNNWHNEVCHAPGALGNRRRASHI